MAGVLITSNTPSVISGACRRRGGQSRGPEDAGHILTRDPRCQGGGVWALRKGGPGGRGSAQGGGLGSGGVG